MKKKELKNTTKRELVTQIAGETGVSQQNVYAVIQHTLDLIIESLAEGKNIELRNFGVFEVRERKQRIGRNPMKPERVVTIPSRKVVKFKPGKIMKARISDAEEAAESSTAPPPFGAPANLSILPPPADSP